MSSHRFNRPSLHPPTSRPIEEALDVEETPALPPPHFDQLALSPTMQATIEAIGYTVPTPIQIAAIPPGLLGLDLIGQAQTGSGKTAAFGVPIIERLDPHLNIVQALILCPTRELAVQVHEELTRLAAHHHLRSLAIYGGEAINRQIDALRQGAHIVVATPGRLLDLIQRQSLTLAKLKVVVLDEADRLLDMGFAPDIERILRLCPLDRQTLLFSATLPVWIHRLAQQYMNDPITIELSERPEIPSTVRQYYLQTTWSDKTDAVARILDQPDVTMALVFVETKRTADMLEAQLRRRGYDVGVLHGNLTQAARDLALQQFKDSHIRYLIATNVAARGLDIDDISHVINYDVPTAPDEYVHRVGRTGRAGRSGVAVTLITPAEILNLRDVEKHANTKIERATLDNFPALTPEPKNQEDL